MDDSAAAAATEADDTFDDEDDDDGGSLFKTGRDDEDGLGVFFKSADWGPLAFQDWAGALAASSA